MITNMTEGSPSKILWKFSIPMLISVIFQQLYNIVDSIIAGQFISVDALAAVGASYPITMIFLAIATGSNIGCSVVISQLFGGKNYAKVKTAIGTSVISILFLSSLLTILGLFFCNDLMKLLHTPSDIFSDSALYLRIYILSLIFIFLYNICNGIFTALGDSKTPLYFLIISSVFNMILALILVILFHLGVAGVAWATFIAQGLSSVLASLALIRRLKNIPTTEAFPLFSYNMLFKISRIAIPSILQQSFISVGNLFIQGLINSYGSTIIAGYSAAIKLNTFAITSFSTLSSALSSFTAQNIGAGKLERIKKGFHAGILMLLCIVLPLSISFFLCSPTLIHIFVDSSNTPVVQSGTLFLQIVSPFYLIISIKLLADGVLRGAGAMVPFMISTFSDLILRVILSFVLSNYFGSMGIWISWPIGWTTAAILSCSFYYTGIWKKGANFN